MQSSACAMSYPSLFEIVLLPNLLSIEISGLNYVSQHSYSTVRAAHASFSAHHTGGLCRVGQHSAGGSCARYRLHGGHAPSSRLLAYYSLTSSHFTKVSH